MKCVLTTQKEILNMCEFTVLMMEEEVFKDVIHAKSDGSMVIVRNVLGVSKTFENCIIEEVDVQSERLILQPAKNDRAKL